MKTNSQSDSQEIMEPKGPLLCSEEPALRSVVVFAALLCIGKCVM